MVWLKESELWKFLSVEENREILYFIGGVMAALAIAIWQIYVHFSDKKTSDGLTEEKLEAILKRRDEEIREKYAASEPGSEQRALLEKEQAALEQKRTNLEESLEAAQKVHADIIKLFNEKLTAQLPSDRIEQAKTAITKGDSALAESLLEEVVASGIQQSAEASYQLGLLAKDRVDYKKAWKTLTRAAELAPDNSLYLNETGFMAKTLGNYDTAIEYYEKSLDLDMMAHGPNHTSVAISWNNLGSAWENKGEYDKAIEYYNKALASDLKTLGSEHRNVAIYWNNLGEAYRNKGHYDKAIEYFEKALDSDLKTFGPDHTSVTTRWNNLGAAWDDKGKYDKAIGYYEKALASVLKTLGPVHPRVATYQNNLGLAWNNKGEVDKAIEYFEKALASNLNTLGPDHPSVATYWNNLGLGWCAKGEYDQAIEYYEKALASNLKIFGPDHPSVAACWNNLGKTWQDKGNTGNTREYYEKALAVVKKAGLEHRVQLVEENIRSLPTDK